MIDRSNEVYKPWDTYNAWKGKTHNIRRLLAASIILFILPLLHFAILFTLLGSIDIQFNMTTRGISNVVLIGFYFFGSKASFSWWFIDIRRGIGAFNFLF